MVNGWEWDGRVTDDRTYDQIQYLEQIVDAGNSVRVDVSFHPVGTFTNNRGLSQEQFMQDIRQHTQRFQISGRPGGSNIQQVKLTIERYLQGLNATYSGHFTYRVDNYDMYQNDWWRMNNYG